MATINPAMNPALRDPDLGVFSPNVGPSRIAAQEGFPTPEVGEAKGTGFLDALEKSMGEANQSQLDADQSIKEIVAGKGKNIHETMLQIQKAELNLKTMMQVRNKILEAYKEIMRMQV